MTSNSARRIVFVVFPGVKLLDLTGPLQVFSDANHMSPGQYEIDVVSLNGGAVGSDALLSVATSPLLSLNANGIDTVIVAGGGGAFTAYRNEALLTAICDLAKTSRRLASVCTGAFVLAACGLLAGRSAVTHWESCQRLREEFTDIKVQDDAIFVHDGPVRTSAGVTAGIDMCLDIVADDLGRQTALALARALVCYLVRPGGQSQFSGPLRQQTEHSSSRFDNLHAWIKDNLAADLSVNALARRAGMSPRNFARAYRHHTGKTPAKAVEAARTEAACHLLEDTDLPLISVATECGFHDDESLRRAMMRGRGVAPGEYRQRFGRARHGPLTTPEEYSC